MKNNLILIFLFPFICFSQSISDNLFFEQAPDFRGYLITTDFNLKDYVKKIINTNYSLDENGLKSKIGYCDAKYFSHEGLLLKSETYSTNNSNDKSIDIYYYSNNKLDSTNSPSKKEYRYE